MLRVIPITLQEANDIVALLHRHHKPVVGHKISIGCVDKNNIICGAAILGRPVARLTDQIYTIEVTRLVTDGTKNSCSFLYGASARIAKEMGYQKIQTFILDNETGISLVASGWTKDGKISQKIRNWSTKSRPNRRQDQPQGPKQKYSKLFYDEGLNVNLVFKYKTEEKYKTLFD